MENNEIYVDIENYPNYQISNFGNVLNKKTNVSTKGYLTECGYYRVALYNLEGKKDFLVHRLVSNAFLQNPNNKRCVDHIDGNKINNHVGNLRFATHNENGANQKKQQNTTSNYKGVSFVASRKRYYAYIKHNQKKISLGGFSNEIDCAKAYDKKAKEIFGEFAKLNFVE